MNTSPFWSSFDRLSGAAGLTLTWQQIFRADYDNVRPFLLPTTLHSTIYPCLLKPPCGCHHEVHEDPEWEFVGVCTCDDPDCEPLPLTRQDTMIFALNVPAFSDAIRAALGFQSPSTPPRWPGPMPLGIPPSQCFEIGMHPPLHAPVFLCFPDGEAALLRAIETLVGERHAPCLILTPTRKCITPLSEATLARSSFATAALSDLLVLSLPSLDVQGSMLDVGCSQRPSIFNLLSPVSSVLDPWSSRLASTPNHGTTLIAIHKGIDAVREEVITLRTAKERLEKMHSAGLFAFTQKVDATSFKVLCAILAEGDIAKAGRRLKITDPMMRYILRQWEDRGPAYSTMLDLVRWRKQVGRKETLALRDDVMHERAEPTDYPGLLSDILDGLLSMTEANREEICEDLTEVLRRALASASAASRHTAPTPVRSVK